MTFNESAHRRPDFQRSQRLSLIILDSRLDLRGMADLPQAEEPSFSQVVIQHVEPLSQLPGVQVDYARIVDLTAKQQYEDLRQLYHR